MTGLPPTDSPFRSWIFLVGFSFRRLARVRQMVGIAISLLLITCIVVSIITIRFGWDRTEQQLMRRNPMNAQIVGGSVIAPVIQESPFFQQVQRENKGLSIFSRWIVFLVFLGFLMPLWSLSFAISALGSDRESRSLVWLLTRPMPRWGIYLAKFLAVLPWCLALNLGGFALLCYCGGEVGRQALKLYWPAVIGGTLAFTAIFHLIGAIFSRPAVVALIYAFFFETVLSELPVPGTLKRLSINYYTRCLMYTPAEEASIPTESASLFVPVSEVTAWSILILTTVVLTTLGMWWFARTEYRDDV